MNRISSDLRKYDINIGLNYSTSNRIVFVDFMNTIVKRNCTLKHILYRWSKIIGSEFSIYSPYLFNYRMNVLAGKMHNIVPSTIIYEEIANQCVSHHLLDEDNKFNFCKRSYQVEIDLELKSQSLINKTIRYIEHQKKNNHEIYIISDFRFSAEDILFFLKKHQIIDYFKGVFSSCDFGVTKKEGRLYPIVLDKLQLNSSECIMIGDNFVSDCVHSSEYGIRAFWLRKSLIMSIIEKIKFFL